MSNRPNESETDPEAEGGDELSTGGAFLDSLRARYGLPPRQKREGVETEQPSEETAAEPIRRYEIEKEIARGGMGAIFRVRDKELRRSLAMKVLLGDTDDGEREPGAPAQDEHLNRFLEEARITAQLAHPGVVPVHEVGMDADGNIFFTMSLIRGRTLSQIIKLARAGKEGWTRTRALQVILRVCETMAFAHDRGVIHRDIKPDNVMVGRFGETLVMDWGIAKVLGAEDLHDIRPQYDAETLSVTLIESPRFDGDGASESPMLTMDGTVVGTPAYMPPEQARGQVEDVDRRADVYAIGAMLYELLTGRPPYVEPGVRVQAHVMLGAIHLGPPKPIGEFASDLPDEIVAICDKAMARELDDRYASAQDLAEDIQAFIEGRVVQAYRTGAIVEIRKWIERNRALAASVAATIVVVIAGSIGFAIHARNAAEAIGVERDKERAARHRAEGLRLSARAGNEGAKNPGLALGLAIQGAVRADAAYGRTALYRALGNLHEFATLEGHSGYVDRVAFNAAGTRVVSVAGSVSIVELIVWDIAERKPRFRLKGHTGTYRAYAFAPTGRMVATASTDDTIRIWDVDGGTCTQVIDPKSEIVGLSCDGAGENLAAIDNAGRLQVWRASDGASRLDLALGGEGRFAVAFAPDGAGVAVLRPDGSVTIRSIDGGTETVSIPASSDVRTPAGGRLGWLDGGRQLVTWHHRGSSFGRVEIWDLGTAERVAAFGDTETRCRAPVWNTSGSVVAIPFESDDVLVWDVAERRERRRLTDSKDSIVYALSPNGRHLVATSAREWASYAPDLWDTHTGERRARLGGHAYSLAGIAVSDDGVVATASADTTVRLWSATSALTYREIAHWDVLPIELFADARRAFVRRSEGTGHSRILECRSVPAGRLQYSLPEQVIAFNRKRDQFAIHVAATNRVEIRDALDGSVVRDLPGMSDLPEGAGAWIGLTPDDSQIVLLSASRYEFRDARDGTRRGGFELDAEHAGRPIWFPDGRSFLVRKGQPPRMYEIDATTGEVVRRYESGHRGHLTTVAVHPDGDLIATGAADRSVALWDRATAEIVHRYTGLFMGDLRLAFDPTGRFVIVRTNGDAMWILDVEQRTEFAVVDVAKFGLVAFQGGDVIVGTPHGPAVLRVPLDPIAAARRAQPRPLSPLELGTFDVGTDEERKTMTDAYIAWTYSPERIASAALTAAAQRDDARTATYLMRLEAVAPEDPSRFVVRAALHASKGDSDAAIAELERALEAGGDTRLLESRVFNDLRKTPGWKAIADRRER